jgi:NTE family protein
MTKKALYLAGGGARGAYQAGVLKAISIILGIKKIPFEMISGVSVGCINAAVLAEYATDFSTGTDKLETLWRDIYSQQIFNASNYSLSKSMLRNISNLIVKQRQSGYLLDTSPLYDFIQKTINFRVLDTNIKNKHIEIMEVISHCYDTHQTISFYQHYGNGINDWNYPSHASQRVNLQIEHFLASSALPLFFRPIKLDNFHYGDGSMRLISPLRSAIRFQVDKILILGTRRSSVFVNPNDYIYHGETIGLARILGSMLNGLFLDNLDRDIEMVNRMNDIAGLLPIWKKRRSPWRPIETLYLRPSQDIALIAQMQYHSMPALLRFMLNALGAKRRSGDLLSFLLFEHKFTSQLIQLGIEDTLAISDTIIRFFDD